MQQRTDRDDLVIARQAPFVDVVIHPCAEGVVGPAVDGGDEFHLPELAKDQAQQVGLVIMPMPDGDVLLLAELIKRTNSAFTLGFLFSLKPF